MTHSNFTRMPRLFGLILVSAVAMVLLAATPAFADTTPADGEYGAVKGEQAGGGSGGSLPFTGMNLLLIVAAGGAIAASGVGLRAVAQRAPRD
jgi:hypothetical protein